MINGIAWANLAPWPHTPGAFKGKIRAPHMLNRASEHCMPYRHYSRSHGILRSGHCKCSDR